MYALTYLFLAFLISSSVPSVPTPYRKTGMPKSVALFLHVWICRRAIWISGSMSKSLLFLLPTLDPCWLVIVLVSRFAILREAFSGFLSSYLRSSISDGLAPSALWSGPASFNWSFMLDMLWVERTQYYNNYNRFCKYLKMERNFNYFISINL